MQTKPESNLFIDIVITIIPFIGIIFSVVITIYLLLLARKLMKYLNLRIKEMERGLG